MPITTHRAAEIKFCDEPTVEEAGESGVLNMHSPSMVAWDRAFEQWNPYVEGSDLARALRRHRLWSKSIVKTSREGAARIARGQRQSLGGFESMVIPVNEGNLKLLLRLQGGQHDNMPYSDEAYAEILSELRGGAPYYAIWIALSEHHYSFRSLEPSEVASVTEVSKEAGCSALAVHGAIESGLLTAAEYLGVRLVLRDKLYKTWLKIKRENSLQKNQLGMMLFSPEQLIA